MEIRIEYSGIICLFLAVLCMTIPLNWLFAAIIAAVFHELCHILAVRILGGTICSLRIGIGGAVLNSVALDEWKNLICILSGPLGSILLVMFSKWIPRTAFCGLIQGCCNLIPIYPLDGGQALSCLTTIFFSDETACGICTVTDRISRIVVLSVGIYASVVLNFGLMPLLLAIFFLVKIKNGKISCKEGNHGVQYSYHIQ